uniref:Branched-chain amino acid transport system permease protein n=1 Tax=uncultured Chloroflexota bacterium TaxID=166587 RepID=H5SCX6_9CHLR|nr:branched-chain amino acid transport system permease protein [uncultured Chloroflexota bacterium]
MKKAFWDRWGLQLLLLLLFPLTIFLPGSGIINPYLDLVLKYIGINIILTISLNLVNGYMGEFSVGHAGFMAIGAYVASILTVWVFPPSLEAILFPLALLAGGLAAGLAGLGIAFPSFRTRGDYLAIVTLAFNMIIKSVLENLEVLGGPRGFMGMTKLTTLWWVYLMVILVVYLARNFVYSSFGRGVLSIREDETASELVSVNTRQVKVLTFVFSAFLAGLAGGLFAHELQFINPRSFTILKSTDMLVMVYLGGIASLGGSILGATVFTIVMEGLRSVLQFLGISQEWRLVVAPLMLILLMLFRPRGIMGLREFRFLLPRAERSEAIRAAREAARANATVGEVRS